jgi:acyl carrier protein
MSNAELMESIQKVIKDVLNNQTLTIKGENRLMDDLGLESIDLIDISSELENTIGKELDFKDVADFVKKNGGAPDLRNITVNQLIEYIEANP